MFGRLAGYEDVNDADRLPLDPVMCQVVGGRAVDAKAVSASQIGRFETETLAMTDNREALTSNWPRSPSPARWSAPSSPPSADCERLRHVLDCDLVPN